MPSWFRKSFGEEVDDLDEKAQIATNHGAKFEVHVAEQAYATALRKALKQLGVTNVNVILTPP